MFFSFRLFDNCDGSLNKSYDMKRDSENKYVCSTLNFLRLCVEGTAIVNALSAMALNMEWICRQG